MRSGALTSVALSLHLCLTSSAWAQAVVIQKAPPPHHEVNFDVEREHPDTLYQQRKLLEALPLYEDLGRQDSTVAPFAARYGEALLAMLTDIDSKIKLGTLSEEHLDPSLRNIRNLERANVLGAWIAINAADAGIVQDYPHYRDQHRQHLVEYINTVLIR